MGVYLAPSILVSTKNKKTEFKYPKHILITQDHSCQPNAWVEFEGNKLVLRSKCDQEKPDMSKVFIVSSDQLSGSMYFWNIPQIFSSVHFRVFLRYLALYLFIIPGFYFLLGLQTTESCAPTIPSTVDFMQLYMYAVSVLEINNSLDLMIFLCSRHYFFQCGCDRCNNEI